MPITKDTALKIAMAYQEVETAEKLLADIKEAISRREQPDIRDSFGRLRGGLELDVPSSGNSRRLFNVQWELAMPIVEAHVAQQRAIITALSETAKTELG